MRSEITDADDPNNGSVSILPPPAPTSIASVATHFSVPHRSEVGSGQFDYLLLSPESCCVVLESERRLDEIERRAVIAGGRLLRTIRNTIRLELGHGHWLKWLKDHCKAQTTAAARIRAANWADETAIVATLGAAALYRAAGAPDPVKQDVLKLIVSGETVGLKRVEFLIQTYKEGSQSDDDRTGRGLVETINLQSGGKRKHRKMPTQDQLAAADELVTALRTKFEDNEVRSLVSLWERALKSEIIRILGARDCVLESRA